MRLANPFQIYFLIWFLVFAGYYSSSESYISISTYFVLIIWILSFFSFLLLLFFRHQQLPVNFNVANYFNLSRRFLIFALIIVVLAMPFVYQRANELSGGDIFSVEGYINLRRSMTEEGAGFGVLGYFSILACVVTAIKFYDFLINRQDRWITIVSLLVGLFYAYVGTGRTFFLLLFLLLIIPAVIRGSIGWRGIAVSFFILIVMFLVVAAMTAKGISVDAGVEDNIASILESLRSYTVAPFLAFHNLMESDPPLMWGQNSFRFFIAVLNFMGFEDAKPVALIRDYQFVPDPTNVYTVYEAYFLDFNYFGMIIPPLFLVGHWFLYRRALRLGGVWLFYYAASTYPLVMQFFQDQYLSLFSMWIQMVFWIWIFIGRRGRILTAYKISKM